MALPIRRAADTTSTTPTTGLPPNIHAGTAIAEPMGRPGTAPAGPGIPGRSGEREVDGRALRQDRLRRRVHPAILTGS